MTLPRAAMRRPISVMVGAIAVVMAGTMALARMPRDILPNLPGVAAPPPFGASQRSIVVRVDPERLRSYGLSPDDVVAAVSATNTISPSGNIRIGDVNAMVPLNSVVKKIGDLGAVPLRSG